MKYKAFLAALALAGLAVAGSAHAQTANTVDASVAVIAVEAINPQEQKLAELADLKTKAADPATSSITRFFLHLKIRQLENELNIKKALE